MVTFMDSVEAFKSANALLSQSFGYHVSEASSEALRARLDQGGLLRFRHAVRLVAMQLSHMQIEPDLQSIHAMVEAQLYHLQAYRQGVVLIGNKPTIKHEMSRRSRELGIPNK